MPKREEGSFENKKAKTGNKEANKRPGVKKKKRKKTTIEIHKLE